MHHNLGTKDGLKVSWTYDCIKQNDIQIGFTLGNPGGYNHAHSGISVRMLLGVVIQ
jgi:hypothetical protein